MVLCLMVTVKCTKYDNLRLPILKIMILTHFETKGITLFNDKEELWFLRTSVVPDTCIGFDSNCVHLVLHSVEKEGGGVIEKLITSPTDSRRFITCDLKLYIHEQKKIFYYHLKLLVKQNFNDFNIELLIILLIQMSYLIQLIYLQVPHVKHTTKQQNICSGSR